MKKLITTLLLLMIPLCALNFFTASAEAKEFVIYVSPNGSDGARGTIDAPLRTVNGAQLRARSRAGSMPVRVIFRGGEYFMPDKGVTFTAQDSGTKAAPVSYEAYPGEEVIFSGAHELDISQFTEVKDAEVLKRLPESAHGKVVQMDLKSQGFSEFDPVFDACVDANGSTSMGRPIYNFLVLDGERQMLSQWPNGEQNFESFVKVYKSGNATTPGTFGYSGTRPSRWLTAKDAYIFCHPNNDYCSERIPMVSVDTFNRSITVSRGGQGFAESKMSRIWKAYNLLEEIDVPQEWYIDRENMILYYYPPESMKEDSVLSIATLKDSMLTLRGASNISFKNIIFEATRYYALNMRSNTHDVSVTGCSFRNIGLTAIRISGDETDRKVRKWKGVNPWYIDAPHDITIDKNMFYHIGKSGLEVDTRTVGDIVMDNISITNNYFTQIAWFTGGSYVLGGDANGIYFNNNLAHNTTGGGISMGGYSTQAKYNEMYNLCKACSDVGLLYHCFIYEYRGSEWAYNLLYDSVSKLPYGIQFSAGIYNDCITSGKETHHNIVSGMPFGFTINGGHFHDIHDNVFMDITQAISNLQEQGQRFGSFAKSTKADINLQVAAETPGYAKRYPDVYGLLEKDEGISNYNNVVDNIGNSAFSTEAPKPMDDYIIKNNTETASYDDFVDAEHLDYRLKKDSPLLAAHPNALTEENFDMASIGPQDFDFKAKLDTSFAKLYPADGQKNVDNTGCTLVWEPALYADEYIVTVAADKEMKNIVYHEVSPYNYFNLDSLEAAETTYYWTVRARNNRRHTHLEWDCSDEVYSFSTVGEEPVELSELSNAIAQAKAKLPTISEGVNYREGALEFVKAAISEAEQQMSARGAAMTQSEAQSVLLTLKKKLAESSDYLIIKFANIDTALQNGTKWTRVTELSSKNIGYGQNQAESEEMYADCQLSMEGQTLKITNLSGAGAQPKPQPEKNSIYCFKAKIDTNNTWGGIAFNQARDFLLPWTTPNYNLVITKEQIELQKTGSGYLDTVASKNIFTNDEWHDWAIGTVETMIGCRIIVMLDGAVIFDYNDDSMAFTEGAFTFYGGTAGYNFEIQAAGELPSMPLPVEPKKADITELNPSADNMSTGAVPDNTLINFRAVMNTDGAGQALSLGSGGTELKQSEAYAAVVKDDVIYLKKYSQGGESILAAVDNDYIRNGQGTDITFGKLIEYGLTRVLLYADGNKIFDYTDYTPLSGESKFTAYALNGGVLGISGGSKSPCDIAPTERTNYGVVSRWGTNDITPQKTVVKFTSSFNATKLYYWHEVMEDGDPDAKLTIMMDLDDQQFGEEEYVTIPVDFTRGETGWQLLYVFDVKLATVTVESSGKGRIPQNAFLGRKSASSDELVEYSLLHDLTMPLLFAFDVDFALGGDGEAIPIGHKTRMSNNQMLISVDAAAAAFGADAQHETDGNTAILRCGGVTSAFEAGSREYTMGEEKKVMKVAPELHDGVLYIPLEGVCNITGKKLYRSSYGLSVAADEFPTNYKLSLSDISTALKMFME